MLSCGGDQDNFYKFQKCQKKQHSQTLEEIKQFQHIKKAKLPKELEFKHFDQLHEELKDDLRNFYQRIQKEKFVKDQKNQKTIIFLSQMQDPEDSTVKTFYNYLQNLEIKKTNLKPFFQLLYFKDMFQNEPQQLKEDPEFLKKYLKNFKKQLFSHFINSENCITLQILDLINEHLIKNFDKKGKLVQPNRRKKVTDKKQKMQQQNQIHQQQNRNSVSIKQDNKQNNTQNQEQAKWKSEIQEQQVEEDIEEEIQFKEFKNSLGQPSLNNNNTASELQQKKDQELLNKIIFGSSDDEEDENNDNKNKKNIINQIQKPFQKEDLQNIFVKPQAKYESDHNYFKQQQTYLSTQEDSPLKLQRKPESDNLLNYINNNSQEKQKKLDQNFRFSRSYMPTPNMNNRQSQQNYKSVFFNKESFITQPIALPSGIEQLHIRY
ncbi:hypothetical protein PPERSA_10050 [Pseudocohnilembus persalinus]|uniref:Uncharacterized protein n=1 Tax=Pseudocohnilembus persalinus TaxID=266149 RepID=A0A0V0QJN7_PSEPJ|nr:hypothetical protein PPERSA_10050 [Pseudocohnilembus persalinus]|eukprot:KRX02433.1 hypothetical protein PPERSA_10050 [Pseudocohnilembus persalinus]